MAAAHPSQSALYIAACLTYCPALSSAASGEATWATSEAKSPIPSGSCLWEARSPTSMGAAVCVIIPHTRQPHCACGSLDAMGSVCIALAEVHTWPSPPFPASKVPSVWGVSSNPSWCMGHTAWHCPVPPSPWKQTPKPPSAPWGQQTHSPLQSRLLSKGTGAKGRTGVSRAEDQGTPEPTHSCITASSAGHC